MSDNTELNLGTGGDIISTDDIAGVKVQRVKVMLGADGVNDGDLSSANPLPVSGTVAVSGSVTVSDGGGTVSIDDGGGSVTVDAVTLPLPTGAATEATLGDIKTSVQTLDNAIAGSEMQVDIVAALPAGTNNIGDVDIASIAAGDNNIGNVDIVTMPSIPAGTNNIGDVDVLTLPALPSGANNIGSVNIAALPNEGQQTMANSISVAIASDQTGFPEVITDGGSPGATGTLVMVHNTTEDSNRPIQQIALTNSKPIVVAIVDSNGDQLPSIGGGTEYLEDDTHNSGDTGKLILAVRNDFGTSLTDGDGDYSPIAVDQAGRLLVTISDAGTATSNQYAEDSAHSDGDMGKLILGVRNDGDIGLVDTDGDYSPISVNNKGHVRVDVAINSAGIATEASLLSVKTAVETIDNAIVGSEMQVDIVAALPAGTNNIGDVDVLTLPALPAGSNNIGDVDVLTLPALVAGSAIVGKVGIDQTTPGTTNKVSIGTDGTVTINAIPAGSNNIGDVDILSIAAGDNNIGNVDVVSLPAIPAGNNNIGDVDIATIAAGDNNIGNVDIVTMPSIPAGTNNIGDVDVLTLPALPAGSNNIGDVDVLTLPSLVAGNANIGDVDIASFPTLTKGTQGSTGVAVQQYKDAGRTAKRYYCVAHASGTTTTETAVTLTHSSQDAATATATSFTPTSGKTFRITAISFATRGHNTATAQTTTFNLRMNTAGAVTTGSTPILLAMRSATAAVANSWDRVYVDIPDGIEIYGDGTKQWGVTAAATFTTNAPTWDVCIIGMEY